MPTSVSRAVFLDLLAPVSGVIVPLEEVPDPVFSRKLVGDGLAIDPTSDLVLAPFSGTITQLHSSHHALALRSDTGVEALIHIGLDTVQLRGEGFTPKVRLGDQVLAGQPLIGFDPVLVGRKARSLLTVVVITHPEGGALSLSPATGLVEAGSDRLFRLTLNGEPPGLPGTAGPSPEREASAAVILRHQAGLHARPAALLASTAKGFASTIRIRKDNLEANGKSVVALLGLAAQDGDRLELLASGSDAGEAVLALTQVFREGLGEMPHSEPPAGDTPVRPAAAPASADPDHLVGLSAAPGLAVGHVFQVRQAALETGPDGGQDPAQERARLAAALAEAGRQLDVAKASLPGSAAPARAEILVAHQAFLSDPELTDAAWHGIARGQSAGFAWRAACEHQAGLLEAMSSPLLRERAQDLRDVARRVLTQLAGRTELRLEVPEDSILIAESLTPSETAQLDRTRVRGFCTTTGGPTSHVAILARSLGIPAICAINEAALDLPDRTLVVLDGSQGLLRRNPGEADLIQAMARIGRQADTRLQEREAAQKPGRTADGHGLEVAANIRTVQEAREALAAGADGVGLLRSEFLFQDRASAPTEEEQAAEYAAMAQCLGPNRRLVVRTLDVGGDKPLAFLPLPREDNPYLGLRGIRVSLDHPDLFRSQLRAILRAAPLGNLHIMFPMVATLEELRAAKAILAAESDRLGRTAAVGVMVEVPSAALMADQLAQEVDFLSIGTNDLTQYCLAMDRGHPRLGKQADALHPAVLKLIDLTVAGAHRHGKWVGVCGGLASDVLALPALLGLGVDEVSVSTPAIGAVKARLATLSKAQCIPLAQELLLLATATDVRARLARFAN